MFTEQVALVITPLFPSLYQGDAEAQERRASPRTTISTAWGQTKTSRPCCTGLGLQEEAFHRLSGGIHSNSQIPHSRYLIHTAHCHL